MDMWDIVVVGAGAAGIFAALRAKELSPEYRVLVLEKFPKTLRKTLISGGGRCNVTHDCHDLEDLLQAYPRGGHRLEAIFLRFMPQDTIDWFEAKGVKLKTEADGRMFPVTNKSQTIADCLLHHAERLGVKIQTNTAVRRVSGRQGQFTIHTKDCEFIAKRILLATGGASKATNWLSEFGHELSEDIPSLFTFCCNDPVIVDLPGVSVQNTHLRLLTEPNFESYGPLLITHWGLSGPAILKLSAFAARVLANRKYQAELICDLLPEIDVPELGRKLESQNSGKQIQSLSPFAQIPKRLWRSLTSSVQIGPKQTWGKLDQSKKAKLMDCLKSKKLRIDGKGVFKEEFVTSGGLPLHEVDVYTMESKKVPGLFIAGELLDVDGVTGGFNFQNAWATGFIAGEGLTS